jgi:hypothetical protein
MADTRTFDQYFGNRGALPGEQVIEGDELLVLRGATVYRAQSSTTFALASMNANAVETVINTVDVWEPIGGTMGNIVSSTDFTFAANAYTYIGVTQLNFDVISTAVTLAKAGQGQVEFEIGIFVNGSLHGTGFSTSSTAGWRSYVAVDQPRILATADVIDLRIRNLTGIDNVTVIDAKLSIGG